MRLVSYRTPQAFAGEPGRAANLGIIDGERVVPASALGADGPATMVTLLSSMPESLSRLKAAWVTAGDSALSKAAIPLDKVELLAPVPRPGKIIAVGMNYASHAGEQAVEAPDHPNIFAKFPTAVVGHGAEIRWHPKLTQAVDLEAELGVVIGRTCRRVDEAEALDYVGGYTCLNDMTARDLQYSDRQFVRGKSLDTFCPMGPVLVTADELGDAQDLAIACSVGDEVLQQARTSQMYFSIAEIVSHCSMAFTLEPGDVIATGTPSGVGVFRKPPRFLADGDRVTVEIEGIGALTNVCRFEHATEVAA